MLTWVRRYLPNELVGTASALLGASVALALSGSLVLAAIVGTVGESIGFYAVAVLRIAAEERGRAAPGTAGLGVALRTGVAALAEYGPAEAIDMVVARPALFYAGSLLLTVPALGWLTGKFAADVLFYVIAAVSRTVFERRRMRAESGIPRHRAAHRATR